MSLLIPLTDEHDYLFYGDNLEILRRRIPDACVDLCYIDPPFNSKRTYFQIYNNIGQDDVAQAQAFTDTWTWGPEAEEGFHEILGNDQGRFPDSTVKLIQGLYAVLGPGSLLAYLVHMALRITEIHRVLKSTGSFYLHCDPTASHYLKLICDTVFVTQGGEFQNEIVWHYETGGASKKHYARKHDILLFYTKNPDHVFNAHLVREPRSEKALKRALNPKGARISADDTSKLPTDVFAISALNPMDKERLGYPTQKPEALLERIIQASSNPGDTILDAYCGCGTTVAVAHRLGRRWIGMDISYQAISLILKRLEDSTPANQRAALHDQAIVHGIPRDLAAAHALALDPRDKTRKEFEKWAILTYSSNRARINEKKGADGGIDGQAHFLTGPTTHGTVLLQAKSGHVSRATIATLRGDMERISAELGVLITLNEPTGPMKDEAAAAGLYHHPLFDLTVPRIQVVTVQDMLAHHATLTMPLTHDAVKAAQVANTPPDQLSWV